MTGLDRRVPVSISCPLSLIELIDEKRGEIGRSQYVVRILRQAMKRA